jgi:hypothetical protein
LGSAEIPYKRVTGAMKIVAAFLVFALLVAMLYGIIDIWGTLKKILKELREINGKIAYIRENSQT